MYMQVIRLQSRINSLHHYCLESLLGVLTTVTFQCF